MNCSDKKPLLSRLSKLFCTLVYLGVGVAGGVRFATVYLARASSFQLGGYLVAMGLFLLAVYVSMVLQTALHEAGHLVFGLLTGYRFCSFRLFGLMLKAEQSRLRFRRMKVAGTSGQCLMLPPPMQGQHLPYVWYNLGGVLFNFISAVVLFALCGLVGGYAGAVLFTAGCIGLAMGVLNGVPMRVGYVDNDGANLLAVHRGQGAPYAFWVQLMVNYSLGQGQRLGDMPDQWFVPTPGANLQNPLVATQQVLYCNRLMDTNNFAALPAMQQLCSWSAITGLHRHLLTCDIIYCLLLTGDITGAKAAITKSQRQFMLAMRVNPGVARTIYLLSLVGGWPPDNNPQNTLAHFQRTLRYYPYPADAKAEYQLVQLAKQTLNQKADS